MENALFNFTWIVNFLALIEAVWLGMYLITRNPRVVIAWLTGIGLWMIGGFFLNVIFALNPPSLPDERPLWMQLILIFWAGPLTERGGNPWLLGWSIAFGIVIWHHVTTLIRGELNPWRWTRIISGYVVAVVAVILRVFTNLLFSSEAGDPLYVNTLQGGPLYPIFGVALLLYSWVSYVNLIRSSRNAQSNILRKQFSTLANATLIAALAGPIAIAGSGFGLPVPYVGVSLPLGISLGILGYGVARYSALVKGRTMRRDFLYSAISLTILISAYLAGTWMMLHAYQLPSTVYVVVALMGIVTHSSIGVGRRALDNIIYQRNTSELRANLRRLSQIATEQEDLQEILNLGLDTICTAVRATYGLLLVIREEVFYMVASYQWKDEDVNFSLEAVSADDLIHLKPLHFPPPLDEAALLVPLYGESEQIGAIILGRPINGIRYSKEDVEQLLDPSDKMAVALHRAQVERVYLEQINQYAQKPELQSVLTQEKIPQNAVEKAFRNLKDYSYLGDSSLADLELVRSQLPQGSTTHIDRGKVVYQVLMDALEKLRPEGKEPGDLAPREWHPFLVLHAAYVEDTLNRDIMSRLYISEGTFNRTRRAAIRSVARVLEEMELSVQT